jgi:hypothetical protein
MKALIVAALALLVTSISAAQTASTLVNLSWTAPTLNIDGTTIAGKLAYNLYQGNKGSTFTKVASALPGVSTSVTSTTAGSCFAVTTLETVGTSTTESALSTTVCAFQPNSPGNLTVAVMISVH